MPTVCLRFRFPEQTKVRRLLEACGSILRQAVDYALDHHKTATFSLIQALYASCRAQYPDLHSAWIQSAVRAGAAVVHSFRNRQRRGKTQAERPALRRPFVYIHKSLLKVDWDGERLTVTFPVTPRDPEPVVLSFRPHHGYARLLDAWKAGKATMGEPTLTPHSISIPLKFPKVQPYWPKTVIGIDSNETNLTAYDEASQEFRVVDTGYAARVSRDHERRARRGQRGKQNPRVRRKVAARHGRLRREKVATFWQGVALALIAWAASLGAALVLEDLKGMKGRLARQAKSRRLRRRLLNFWSVMTFHRVLASKAAFYGVPLIFVDPRDTSRTCPVCGRVEEKLRGQVLACPCGLQMGRHEVAAVNIARRGMGLLGGLPPGQGSVGDPRGPSSGRGRGAPVRGHDGNAQATA
jgi:putative transposase